MVTIDDYGLLMAEIFELKIKASNKELNKIVLLYEKARLHEKIVKLSKEILIEILNI